MRGSAWMIAWRWGVRLVGLVSTIILARMAKAFAMMYSSGITVLDSITTLRDIVGNAVVADGLDRVRREIEEGKNLTQSFANTGMFPPLVLRMLRVGEATGGLDTALNNVAYFYDRDVKESIRQVQTMVEPALTIVMGAILGWIMFAVLMPIYDMITKLKIYPGAEHPHDDQPCDPATATRHEGSRQGPYTRAGRT